MRSVKSSKRLQLEQSAAGKCGDNRNGRQLHETLRNLTNVSTWKVCGNKSNKCTSAISYLCSAEDWRFRLSFRPRQHRQVSRQSCRIARQDTQYPVRPDSPAAPRPLPQAPPVEDQAPPGPAYPEPSSENLPYARSRKQSKAPAISAFCRRSRVAERFASTLTTFENALAKGKVKNPTPAYRSSA